MFLGQVIYISSFENCLFIYFNKLKKIFDCWSFWKSVFWSSLFWRDTNIYFCYLYFNYFHPVYSLSFKLWGCHLYFKFKILIYLNLSIISFITFLFWMLRRLPLFKLKVYSNVFYHLDFTFSFLIYADKAGFLSIQLVQLYRALLRRASKLCVNFL